MLSKRGQVTVFIILGIILVASGIVLYVTQDYLFASDWQRARMESLVVPNQVQPLQAYVSSCIQDLGYKAVSLLGQQSGYLNLPPSTVEISELNLFSNALSFGPGVTIPYWYYQTPNTVDTVAVPTLFSMAEDIALYIDEHLLACVQAYEDEHLQLDFVPSSTTVEITDEEVLFSVEFPFTVTSETLTFTFDSFYEQIDVPLGNLFSLAYQIFDFANSNLFFEEMTFDMMALYDEVPLSGSSTDCIAPVWITSQVKEDFKTILTHNIPRYVVQGSQDSTNDLEYETLAVGDFDPLVSVNFLYSKNWPFSMDVIPDREILKGQSLSSNLGELRGVVESFVCYSTYHFVYDVKYPLVILLHKEDYTFQFAMQVILDNNEPRKNLNLGEVIPEKPVDFCKHRFNPLSIFTVDAKNGNPLEGVDVTYKCINSQCSIGQTTLEEGQAYLTEKFPFCVNGFAVGTKNGYHRAKMEVSSNEEGSATLLLEPYRSLDVSVLLQRSGSGDLQEGEKVYLNLVEGDQEFSSFVVYPDQKTITLIPGTYKAELFSFSEHPQGLSLEGRSFEQCFKVPKKGVGGILGQSEQKCVQVDIPGTTLNTVLTGRTQFDFVVSADDLDFNRVEFYVPYQGLPRTLEDLSFETTTEDLILPVFKNA